MNGSELWWGLGGEALPSDWAEDGRLVAKVVSDCGSRVGEVQQTRDGLKVLVDGFRLTKPHTATVVADQVLLDFEGIFDSGQGDPEIMGRLLRLSELLSPQNAPRLPGLEIPASRGSVDQLIAVVAESHRDAAERNYIRNEVTNMASVCKKCRTSVYLADAVVAWAASGERNRTIVASAQPRLAKAQGFTFPDSALGRRFRTYDDLIALYSRG